MGGGENVEKKYKYLIIGIIIIVIIAIIGIGAYIYLTNGSTNGDINIDPSTAGKTVLKVHANDNVSGKVTVYEYSNIQKNANGTYNLSQFGDYYGLLGFYEYQTGSSQDIQIIDGEAEYTVTNGTQFLYVYPFVTDLSNDYGFDGSNKTITLELYINGVKKFSSTSEMYADQADISFGDKLIDLSNGKALSDNQLVPDTEHNKYNEMESTDDSI